jgi:hypothetical protein
VSSLRRPRHRPTAPSPSQTSTRGTAPNVSINRHQPAYRSSARLAGISTADAQRVAGHHRQHRQLLRGPPLPEADRQLDRRGTRSRTARPRRPRSWCVPPDPAARIHRPQQRHPITQRANRMRPADPLGDHRRRIDGYTRNNSRIRGSSASTTDPIRRRRYRAGSSPASALFTVFLVHPPPVRSPRSASAPTGAAGGSHPLLHLSTFLTRLRPGSVRGSLHGSKGLPEDTRAQQTNGPAEIPNQAQRQQTIRPY